MPEHDLTRTDRMALYIRARADAKAARDEAGACGRARERCTVGGALWSPTIRAGEGARRFVRRRDRACRSHGHRPRQGVALFVGRAGEQHWVPQ